MCMVSLLNSVLFQLNYLQIICFGDCLKVIFRCLQVSPLNDIDKILDSEMRPTVADDSDASKLGSKQIFVKQYLVKWKGLSYLHCTW